MVSVPPAATLVMPTLCDAASTDVTSELVCTVMP